MTKLQKSQKSQNHAARIVTKSRFDAPAMALIQSLNWPTVSGMIRGETVTQCTNRFMGWSQSTFPTSNKILLPGESDKTPGV